MCTPTKVRTHIKKMKQSHQLSLIIFCKFSVFYLFVFHRIWRLIFAMKVEKKETIKVDSSKLATLRNGSLNGGKKLLFYFPLLLFQKKPKLFHFIQNSPLHSISSYTCFRNKNGVSGSFEVMQGWPTFAIMTQKQQESNGDCFRPQR